MKHKWNVDPQSAITIARLIGELEGVSYILDCLDEPEEYEYIQTMKQKYYKEYFKRKRTEKELAHRALQTPLGCPIILSYATN
jgi:hypothetical protein